MARCPERFSSGEAYCLASGLSDNGPADDFFAGGRRAAEAGAVLVGRGSGVGAAAWAGGGFEAAGAGVCGGSEFMMLTGGIDCDDGKLTFGPGGVTEPDGAEDVSERVRVGQFTA